MFHTHRKSWAITYRPLNWVCTALLRVVIEPRTGCNASRRFIALSTPLPPPSPPASSAISGLCKHWFCLPRRHSSACPHGAFRPAAASSARRPGLEFGTNTKKPGLLFSSARPVNQNGSQVYPVFCLFTISPSHVLMFQALKV